MIFGLIWKGYQCWKGDDFFGYDCLDVDVSKQDWFGYLIGKGKSIVKYFEDCGCFLYLEVFGLFFGFIMVLVFYFEVSMDIDDEEIGLCYIVSEIVFFLF